MATNRALLFPKPVPLMLALALAFSVSGVQANKTETSAAKPVSGFPYQLGSTATRLPDNSVFLPQPAQHLLGLRTVVAQATETHETFRLAGQVQRDPNFSGAVQATQPGVFSAPPGGLPTLGQRVTQGQVLGYLKPVLSSLERSQLEAQLATATKDLLLNQRLLERVREQAVTGGVNISIQEDAALIEFRGHQSRKQAIETALRGSPVALRAPVAGVISKNDVFLGKVVAQGDTLLEIVNPQRLWVEATNYDLKLADRIHSAQVETADGTLIPLSYRGQGFQLRNQAVQLQFQLPSSTQTGLAIDQGVNVLVQTNTTVRGVTLPTQAISRRANGDNVVWVRHSAEVFTPYVVRIVGYDANRQPVVTGIKPGERVVRTDTLALTQAR